MFAVGFSQRVGEAAVSRGGFHAAGGRGSGRSGWLVLPPFLVFSPTIFCRRFADGFSQRVGEAAVSRSGWARQRAQRFAAVVGVFTNNILPQIRRWFHGANGRDGGHNGLRNLTVKTINSGTRNS